MRSNAGENVDNVQNDTPSTIRKTKNRKSASISPSKSLSSEEEVERTEESYDKKYKVPKVTAYETVEEKQKDIIESFSPTESPCSSLNNYTYFFIAILVLLIAACIGFLLSNNYAVNNDVAFNNGIQYNIQNVKETLINMRWRYKNQEKSLWGTVFSSIKRLLEKPEKPSIIVLLGNTADTLDCLAVLLGNVSSNALNSHTLHLTPEKLEPNVGSVIESLRHKIQENKAVVSIIVVTIYMTK